MSSAVLPQTTPLPGPGASFDEVVVPHLGAGYRLACWLLRNEDDADDVVQEASLRAFRYFRTFTGGNGRAWFLRIVRNTCWSWRLRRVHGDMEMFDEEQHSGEDTVCDPETLLVRRTTAAAIDQALEHLPSRFRELIVLREMEGLTYREMADAMGIPMGTVMSGLSRARRALRCALDQRLPFTPLPPSSSGIPDAACCRQDTRR